MKLRNTPTTTPVDLREMAFREKGTGRLNLTLE
jgi:hypothetical protein